MSECGPSSRRLAQRVLRPGRAGAAIGTALAAPPLRAVALEVEDSHCFHAGGSVWVPEQAGPTSGHPELNPCPLPACRAPLCGAIG